MSELIIQQDMARRYFIETWGCQMNVHDTEKMSGNLLQLGYAPTANQEDADVIILNTCSVREKAQEKVFRRIQNLAAIKRRRPLIIGVAGCVAQQEGDAIFARQPEVDFVLGTQSLILLPDVLERVLKRRDRVVEIDRHPENLDVSPERIDRLDGIRGYITIMEGCDNFCTFCIVPFTRGRERCRSVNAIVEEAKHLASLGYREIQLLGQNVNSYRDPEAEHRHGSDDDFSRLIDAVHRVDGLERIRFTSPHPKDFTSGLMARFRDLPKLCPHMHLPAQSGSSSVLERMRRGYSREDYLRLVDEARGLVPGIAFSTDMIVGFPGETDSEFEDTITLTQRVVFGGMYSFKYSERPLTFAEREQTDDVPETVKAERLLHLQDVQKKIQSRLHQRLIGSEMQVLVEGPSRKRPHELRGRSPYNHVVNFDNASADMVARFVQVEITRSSPNSLFGHAVSGTIV